MLKVLNFIGTRPEAVKMAPIIKQLHQYPDTFVPIVCVTGQHRQLLDPILDLFQIEVDYDLNIMRHKQDLSELTSRLLSSLTSVVKDTNPSWILAQGDTTTVMAVGLTAFYQGVPFAHVEAGLRTGNKRAPFPEEINRRLADLVADIHFAPTERARHALLSEGIAENSIYVTGNTVVDSLQEVALQPYEWKDGPLACLSRDAPLVLITAHRRESFGKQLQQICLAVGDLARSFPEAQFVYPVHPNPNVFEPVHRLLGTIDNIYLHEPLDYHSMVHLMKNATLILTDSGGIQEEAPTFGIPLLVMRDNTERPEGIEAGVAKLVGTNREKIVTEAKRLLSDPLIRSNMSRRINPYGDGKAATRIVSILREHSRYE